jgi:hypothetical protein
MSGVLPPESRTGALSTASTPSLFFFFFCMKAFYGKRGICKGAAAFLSPLMIFTA